MSIFLWIVVGLVVGGFANHAFLWAMGLGVAGGVLGGFLAGGLANQDAMAGFNLVALVVAASGAVLAVIGYNSILHRADA